MNPIYRFTLSANGGAERAAFPVYKDDVSKDFEQQSNEEFYRAKLSGKLTFIRDDYDFIASQTFDTEFGIKIYISYDAGQTWTEYWAGNFWKTNCAFNEDDKNVTLTPDVVDQYNDVLAGMEKEYNLIDLAPEIVPVNLDKRPMIQVYVPGQSVIGCFLSGMWWEQECDAESNETKLVNDFYFALNKRQRILDVTQTGTPILPDFAMGNPGAGAYYQISAGGYSFTARYDETTDPENPFNIWEITRISDGVVLFSYKSYAVEPNMPYSVTLNAVEGSGATGSVTLYVHDMAVYARYVTDVETVEISGQTKTAHEIPENDIVENNRNYNYVIGYEFPDCILFSSILVTTPTKWGIYQPGQYYYNPADNPILGIGEAFPVARSAWGRISIWFAFSLLDSFIEPYWRKEYTLRDAYPLASVISVLLAQIAPNLTHEETADYSKFFYGNKNPLGITQRIFITPKSNMISSGYDQPAQKAPITLKSITNMLRDCFRCYWFIDDQNRFCIEHISYFRNGGTYEPGEPNIGRDLTVEQVTRNGKKWAFGTSEYKFDKPEMAARYQFGWMDDVTQLFDGNPIDIVSKYVNPDNIENIDIAQFTSDVDYILLNPGEISKDGFVLLAGTLDKTNYNYSAFDNDGGYINQNGAVVSLSSWNYTDFLPIKAGQRITVKLSSGGGGYIAFYSSNTPESFISSWQANRGTEVTMIVPDGATYFRACTANPNDPNYISDVWMLIESTVYKLPYVNFRFNGTDHILQNAWVAFIYLQQYYFWDMPARYFKYNGVDWVAQGIKKLKTQTLKFPAYTDPNTLQLIKTNLGNGTIQKMSVNLSSRNAQTTLKYDTE